MVSQQLIAELGVIIKEDYGVDLQPTVVSEIGNTLVGFFELLSKIEYQTSKNNGENNLEQMEMVNK